MQQPLISIIVPCYNVEEYLDRCMISLLKQTLDNIEIILIDDESPDLVPQMCDEYEKKDSRVRVVHKKNGGLGYARNSGLDIATGLYVAFVDSDDFVSTDMYNILYRAAISTNADIVFCGFNLQLSDGNFKKSHEVFKYTEFTKNNIREFMLDMIASSPEVKQERKYYMSVWHSIYRRDLIEDNHIRFMSERDIASEDLPFQIDVINKAAKIVYLPDNLYYYCLNKSSLTATFNRNKYLRFKYLYEILSVRYKYDKCIRERLIRFFIGYTRTQIHHLVISNYRNKREHLFEIVSDPIWREISNEYPLRNIRSYYQKIMYFLILRHCTLVLYIFSFFVNKMRLLKNKF